MKTIFDELQQEVKNWWISLILGILYVIVAISLMFSPLSGYAVLSILFSVSMLFSGLLEISFAVSNRRRVSSWGWYLAGGIIDMILGFYLIAYPMLSMEVIPFIIAFWLMFRGFSSVGYAMDLKRYGGKRLGMVCCFRYSCRHLLAHHLVATCSRRPLRRVHDFVCIPDYRFLPYHAVIRAEKPAQARERVEGKERSISRISSPHEACQKESHL